MRRKKRRHALLLVADSGSGRGGAIDGERAIKVARAYLVLGERAMNAVIGANGDLGHRLQAPGEREIPLPAAAG